jgi:hypothetical protein
MEKTRKNSMILLVITIIFYPILALLNRVMGHSLGNGVNRGINTFYAISWNLVMIAFLFLLPFSIVSLIWSKGKLWLRIIISLILIWPIWILMFMLSGGI